MISTHRFFSECSFLSEISEKVLSGERPEVNSELPSYSHLVSQCWSQDMLKRPRFSSIVDSLNESKKEAHDGKLL